MNKKRNTREASITAIEFWLRFFIQQFRLLWVTMPQGVSFFSRIAQTPFPYFHFSQKCIEKFSLWFDYFFFSTTRSAVAFIHLPRISVLNITMQWLLNVDDDSDKRHLYIFKTSEKSEVARGKIKIRPEWMQKKRLLDDKARGKWDKEEKLSFPLEWLLASFTPN